MVISASRCKRNGLNIALIESIYFISLYYNNMNDDNSKKRSYTLAKISNLYLKYILYSLIKIFTVSYMLNKRFSSIVLLIYISYFWALPFILVYILKIPPLYSLIFTNPLTVLYFTFFDKKDKVDNLEEIFKDHLKNIIPTILYFVEEIFITFSFSRLLLT